MRTPENCTVVRLQRAIGALIDELVDAVDAGEAGDPENPAVLSTARERALRRHAARQRFSTHSTHLRPPSA